MREIVDLPALRAIVERLGTHTGFDGLCGIDFILDENDEPALSELNPRPTPLSASTTREIVDLPAMRAIVERLGTHTGFDGLCGIDFILAENGDPYLSELNPRPTPGYGVRADVGALFAEAARDRLAGTEREPATVTRSSGPMHHFPESLSYAATERTPDAVFGALESLRRAPLDEPRLGWELAVRALRSGNVVYAYRKRTRPP